VGHRYEERTEHRVQSATVEIGEKFDVPSSPEVTWKLLTDPRVVVSCMPGASITEEREDGTLRGRLNVKLGPTTVKFSGELSPQFNKATRRGEISAQGADNAGKSRAKALVTLAVDEGKGNGSTISIDGRIDVSGGLAPFVRTGGAHLTRRMVADFSANLAAYLAASDLADAGPAPDAGAGVAAGDTAAGATGAANGAAGGTGAGNGSVMSTTGAPGRPPIPPASTAPVSAGSLLARTAADILKEQWTRLVAAVRRLVAEWRGKKTQ
jgi:uncharacterized protein